MDGCLQTGVTTFKLKHEIDTGEVLLQAQTSIGPDETAGELHDRLMDMGAEILVNTIALIESGKAKPIPQASLNQNGIPLPLAPKIFSSDCKIQWAMEATRIHNLIRGLSPFPGAFTTMIGMDGKSQMIKVFRSAVTSSASISKPGTIKVISDQLFVSTGTNDIQILELQLEGKKRMHAGDFLRGYNLTQSCLE
jgi:methionyl-tRNA formyltransferase